MNYLLSLLTLFLTSLLHPPVDEGKCIGIGIHPSAATDPAGRVHVVYGQGKAIFYTVSATGETFDAPVRIDSLPGLHLGASRGPQIAATARSVVITAIDKAGDIWAYRLDRSTQQWQPKTQVTDVSAAAKEGFVALSADSGGSYNAVWLDLRGNKQNKIVGARSVDGGRTWSANRILYQSPDGTVCECCQLSVVSRGDNVAVMFRNFLNGSRDMYLLTSTNGGQTFGKQQKMGVGTWTLKACPMDGGGLFMAPDGTVSTVWRRSDTLFTARPGKPEMALTIGKNAKIVSTAKGDYVVFQRDGQLWRTTPNHTRPVSMGPGGYPKLTELPNDRVLCLWEQTGTVRAEIIR